MLRSKRKKSPRNCDRNRVWIVIDTDAPGGFPEIDEVSAYAAADLQYRSKIEPLKVNPVRPLNIENSFPPDDPV